MEKVVQVTRSFLNRIRGFLNIYAGECSTCLRKVDTGCLACDNLRARMLMVEIDNLRDAEEERYYINNPTEECFARITKAVRQAGRPLLAKEIRMPDLNKARKNWLITKMVERKMLTREEGNGIRYSLGPMAFD